MVTWSNYAICSQNYKCQNPNQTIFHVRYYYYFPPKFEKETHLFIFTLFFCKQLFVYNFRFLLEICPNGVAKGSLKCSSASLERFEIICFSVGSLFRKKRFLLNEMFQRNASKFAIFHV